MTDYQTSLYRIRSAGENKDSEFEAIDDEAALWRWKYLIDEGEISPGSTIERYDEWMAGDHTVSEWTLIGGILL